MIPFATEFPVKASLNGPQFIAQVVGWLSGTEYSNILDLVGNVGSGDSIDIAIEGKEEIHFREIKEDGGIKAIGFRYDFFESSSRLWRTEAVMLKRRLDGISILRLRTECIALKPDAVLDSPKKPYIIKSILSEGLGGNDGLIEVRDQAHQWISEDIELALAIIEGRGFSYLPVVYISSISAGRWLLSREEIEKLAYDLGGVAHVVVEPNRSFSFDLRDISNRKNVYGGTIGIFLPQKGLWGKYYIGLVHQDSRELIQALKRKCIELRSYFPSFGWSWSELQEQALRQHRHLVDANQLHLEMEKLYQAEIERLKRESDELRAQQLSRELSSRVVDEGNEFFNAEISRIGLNEVYPGEIYDRIRYAIGIALDSSERAGMDSRSKVVLETVFSKLPVSAGLPELEEALGRATKDGDRLAASVSKLLQRHGYVMKSSNKHIRLEAAEGFGGLPSITLPKTPSEHRGLANQKAQIERALGLTSLKK